MKLTKTEKRINWIKEHEEEIKAARCPEEGSRHNAFYRRGMSGGGYGWWANALAKAGIKSGCMNYWSGSAPTPSTAINAGIANYIWINAPQELR